MSDLVEELAQFSHDPYGFVMFAFPWGESDGELENSRGPEPWQEAILKAVRDGLLTIEEAIQIAVTSGHGIGKSALVAMLILWAISTMEDTVGVVTANTETQLKTKTWVSLATWFRRFIGRDLFTMTATKIYAKDPAHENTWRVDMVPWSEKNPEAFAGLHNKGKRILVVYDEASAIADIIWETTEGALTDTGTQIIWMAFGNPTKNTGRFRDCFAGGKFAHRWQTLKVDSRSVSFTNKRQIEDWISDYGEDSDFVRIRVKGEFPRVDAESFISWEIATEATKRVIEPQFGWPVVLGCDVGRFGDDASVIYPRKGRDARTLLPEIYYGISTMDFVRKIIEAMFRYSASACFVDEGGVGGGVVDRLRQLQINVFAVDFGSAPDGVGERGVKYANKRAEIWGNLREWLPGGAIPDKIAGSELTLVDELIGPNYGLNQREAIQLESKKDMRRRGVPSPNIADALATTFAYPVMQVPMFSGTDMPAPVQMADYDPYEHGRLQ